MIIKTTFCFCFNDGMYVVSKLKIYRAHYADASSVRMCNTNKYVFNDRLKVSVKFCFVPAASGDSNGKLVMNIYSVLLRKKPILIC